MHTYQGDRKTSVDLRGEEPDATMIYNGVTNLIGKSLSKMIHCSLDLLTQNAIIFNKHALIYKDTISARTLNF